MKKERCANLLSSSFIVIGVFRDFTDEEKRRALESYGEKISETDDLDDIFREVMGVDYSVGREPEYVGVRIARTSDDYIEDFEMDFEELHHIAKDFSERFGIPINEIKLIGGTESC